MEVFVHTQRTPSPTPVINEAIRQGVLRQAQARLHTCSNGWLIAGIGIGWPLAWIRNLLELIVELVPTAGPTITFLISSFLGPLDGVLVTTIPTLCVLELLRRAGFIGDVRTR